MKANLNTTMTNTTNYTSNNQNNTQYESNLESNYIPDIDRSYQQITSTNISNLLSCGISKQSIKQKVLEELQNH